MQRFNAEGIDFAFPSQTMYLAGDKNRPHDLGRPPSMSKATNPPTGKSSPSKHSKAKPSNTAAASLEKPGAASIEQALMHSGVEDETS